MDRSGFVGKKDAARFWPSFFFVGGVYTIGMQVFFFIFGLYDLETLFSPLWFKTTALMFVGVGVPMAFFIQSLGWNSAECAKKCVLSIGHCPSCTYRIYDIEAEPDGCTICPECGGAWKLSESE